jgi:hypothetical protein
MIPAPAPNLLTRPYRGLSVQEVDVPLTEGALTDHLIGREVYRRTEFLVLRRGDAAALVQVCKESVEPLFSPVTEARLLAGPDELVAVTAPDVDVGNATALAKVAAENARPGALAYVVTGRYEHVNFIYAPRPVPVRVTEVVPPRPPKLLAMAEQVVAFDEELPPVELVLEAVDIPELACEHPAAGYLLPCRGAGTELDAPVSYLDTRPADRRDWLMIGCERSLQFHRHFYVDEPPRVDLCPRQRPALDRTLAKCCLLERGVEYEAGSAGRACRAIVPWGANLDEVRAALRTLVGLPPVAAAG